MDGPREHRCVRRDGGVRDRHEAAGVETRLDPIDPLVDEEVRSAGAAVQQVVDGEAHLDELLPVCRLDCQLDGRVSLNAAGHLYGADLDGANLTGAYLDDANLTGVDLTEAQVIATRFSRSARACTPFRTVCRPSLLQLGVDRRCAPNLDACLAAACQNP